MRHTLAWVLEDIAKERARQDELTPGQVLPDGTDTAYYSPMERIARAACDTANETGTLTWAQVLEEEFWEAMASEDPEKLRKELIQVAAVAVRWAEQLDHQLNHMRLIRQSAGEFPLVDGLA